MTDLASLSDGWLLIKVVGGLFFVIAALNQASATWFRFRPPVQTVSPQPLVVSPEKRFVERAEFESAIEQTRRERDQIHAKIGGVERGLAEKLESLRNEVHQMELRILKAGEDRATSTHDRINDVLAAVSELRGEMNAEKA